MNGPEQFVARLLLAPSLVIAAAILIKGYEQAGDGFAAGVVASLAILLQHVSFGRGESERLLPVGRLATTAVAGCGVAFLVAFLPLLWGDPLLTHRPAAGEEVTSVGTLELATAVAFDLGIAMLVVGALTGIIAMVGRLREEVER